MIAYIVTAGKEVQKLQTSHQQQENQEGVNHECLVAGSLPVSIPHLVDNIEVGGLACRGCRDRSGGCLLRGHFEYLYRFFRGYVV